MRDVQVHQLIVRIAESVSLTREQIALVVYVVAMNVSLTDAAVLKTLKRIALMQGRDPLPYETDPIKLAQTPFDLAEEWRELAITNKGLMWGQTSKLRKVKDGYAVDTKSDPNSRQHAQWVHCLRQECR